MTGAQDATGGVHERWIVFITVEDRSGTLSALAETFSSRGVSFEAFNTLRVSDGTGVMSIIFRGSARLARVLARTLERLAFTLEVDLVHAADPGLRAVAVVAGSDAVLVGSLAELEAQLAAGGGALESLTVLPPR